MTYRPAQPTDTPGQLNPGEDDIQSDIEAKSINYKHANTIPKLHSDDPILGTALDRVLIDEVQHFKQL